MNTISNMLERIREFASRKGRFVIEVSEFFALLTDIVNKLKETIAGASVSMIFRPDVANIAALNRIPEPEKGWACKVLDQLDEHGNAYIYQYDGAEWNRTPYTILPSDVLTEIEADTLFVKQKTSTPITMSYKGESSASVDLAANAVYSPNHQYIASGGNVEPIAGDVSYTETYIGVKSGQEYLISNVPPIAGAFYDNSKRFVADIRGKGGVPISDVVVKAPVNATYIRTNTNKGYRNTIFSYPVTNDSGLEIKINNQRVLTHEQTMELVGGNATILSGKTVGWYGTSIPAGSPHTDNQYKSSYANIAVQELGGKIINRCYPGGALTTIRNDLGSFMSLNGAMNYKKDLLDLIGTPDEPDYFVFDYGVNDRNLNGDMFKSENWNFDSVDTKNYIGAFNFLIKELYAKKRGAKVIIVTHYSNDHADTNVATFKYFEELNKTLIALAEYWNLPCIKMHHLSGWVCRNGIDTIKPNCPDGIHPASDGTFKSVNFLAGIMKKQLPLALN